MTLRQDHHDIRTVFDVALESIVNKDWETWGALFTEDCIFHPPNEPAVHGRNALRDWGRSAGIERMTWSDFDVRVRGDMAFGTSEAVLRYDATVPAHALGEVSAKQLCVFQRIEGRWNAVAVSFNASSPPA